MVFEVHMDFVTMMGNELKITLIPHRLIILVMELMLKCKVEWIAPNWRMWTFQE